MAVLFHKMLWLMRGLLPPAAAIAPPADAPLPTKVQLRMSGLLLQTFRIAPPVPVAVLPTNRQLVVVGLDR